jgi:hypothetical protein
MCGRSTGTYTNLGDLQRDLRGLSPTPPNKKKIIIVLETCRLFSYFTISIGSFFFHKGVVRDCNLTHAAKHNNPH